MLPICAQATLISARAVRMPNAQKSARFRCNVMAMTIPHLEQSAGTGGEPAPAEVD